MNKIKFILSLVLSIIIVFIANGALVTAVAFATENYDTTSATKGKIDEILSQNNKYYDREAFCLLNWEYGDKKPSAEKAFEILEKSEYEKVNNTNQVFVQLFQTRFNSVIMLDNNVNIDTKESSFKQQEGLSTWSYVVKYFNDYYIIVNYRQKDSVTENNKIGEISTAVYKSVSSENLSELENIKNVGSHYYSYSTYPMAIASISTFGKIICAIFVALELFGVCKLISKHNHK